jgi:zinc D-Ala-D-Ala carboxypeptidase
VAKKPIEPNWDDFPNFSRGEVACQHCGRAEMDEDFMWRLQDLREAYGRPMKITSGYRCPEHPIEARKTSPGTHSTGRAVDVAVSRGEAYSLLRLAIRMGFTGIGVQQKGDGRFLHLDDIHSKEDFNGKKFPRPTIWSY